MRFDNYVTDIDAHTESNTPVFRITGRKFINACLELHSSADRFDRAWKLRQEPVASVLHDMAAVFGDCGRNTVREQRCQFGVRSLFVVVHEPRITGHVGRQYRRQSALDPDWRLVHHDLQTFRPARCTINPAAAPRPAQSGTIKWVHGLTEGHKGGGSN
jgi:hypothetical protein